MATSIDPTYPLYSVACIISALMLLPVLLTRLIRQSWNVGVASLCFWLFFENLTGGIDAIVWRDNADVKLYVYCDIVSHLQAVTSVVKPMATLIITRRLYLITSSLSGAFVDKIERRRDLVIEWTLGLVIPVLVAGPLYYVVQSARFSVEEGFGCRTAPDFSILSALILQSWSVMAPLISISVYYPRVIWVVYRQYRDLDHFLQSDTSAVSRTNYWRIFALTSIDLLVTLPIAILNVVLEVSGLLSLNPDGPPFYLGWTQDHVNWMPTSTSHEELIARLGTSTAGLLYFARWSSPLLAFVVFVFFGLTTEARSIYRCIIVKIAKMSGWKSDSHMHRAGTPGPLGTMKFSERVGDLSPNFDIESGLNASNLYAVDQGKENAEENGNECAICKVSEGG